MKSSTKTLLIAGGGLAVVGLGIYFLTKKPATTSSVLSPAGGGTHNPSLGDPADQNSVAFACNTCFKLRAIGHPNEAASWCQKCTAGGGTVPTSASQMYD